MKQMKKTIIYILLLLCTGLKAQNTIISKEGEVTFVTAQNVYVKFKKTDPIEVGDTLKIRRGGEKTSCLVVKKKSTMSCVCKTINGCKVNKGERIYFDKIVIEKETEENPTVTPLEGEETGMTEGVETERKEKEKRLYKESIRANISGATYSSFSPLKDKDRHRTMLRLSTYARHINDTRFSVETYINYRKNFLQKEVSAEYKTSFFNIYSAALTYDIDTTMSVSLGRKINRKMSSIGPIDGMQIDKYIGDFYAGGIVGFRPDISDFGFNPNLLEYGAYVGHEKRAKKIYSRTTVGLLEQMNKRQTDRRYAYLQHSSTLNRKLSLFGSMELDIYGNKQGVKTMDPRLTNLYISMRYRHNRRLTLTTSYDNRKRIIYYETFRTEVEKLLADDEARQGIRLRINYRPWKYINTSLSYSKRFQIGGQNKSDNINASFSYSRLPLVGGRLSIRYNNNQSNYLQSHIVSVRHSRKLAKGLSGDFYFRMVTYQYASDIVQSGQYYYGGNLSYRIRRGLRASVLLEVSTRNQKNTVRLNTRISKRFTKK